MIQTILSQDKGTATVGDVNLRVYQQIQYKIPSRDIISDAKIEQFSLIDKDDMNSVWAYVIDITSGEKEWISLRNWKDLYDAGAFPNMKQEVVLEDLPF